MREMNLMKRDGFRLTFDDSTFRLYDDCGIWALHCVECLSIQDHTDDDGSEPIFVTNQFRPGAMSSIDADDSIGAVLSFFSLQDGDTDAEYFDDYTPRQLAWRDLRAEELGYVASEIEEAWMESSEFQGRPDYALSVSLSDDGTMDTVVSIYDPLTGESYDERLSEVDREEDGAITADGWKDIRELIDGDHWDRRDEILDPPRSTYRNGDPIGLIHCGCDSCNPSMINGALCHEHGCPDAWRDSAS